MHNNLKTIYKQILEEKLNTHKSLLEVAAPPSPKQFPSWFSIPWNQISTFFKSQIRINQWQPYWTVLSQGFGGDSIKKLFPKNVGFGIPWMEQNANQILQWWLQLDGRILIKLDGNPPTWHWLENTPNGPRPGPALEGWPPDYQPGIDRPPGDPIVPSTPNGSGPRTPWQPHGVSPGLTIPDLTQPPTGAESDEYGNYPYEAPVQLPPPPVLPWWAVPGANPFSNQNVMNPMPGFNPEGGL
jgi:hypothetical protein